VKVHNKRFEADAQKQRAAQAFRLCGQIEKVTQMKLEEDLSTRAESCREKAEVLARRANLLYFCVVVSSVVATVVAAISVSPKVVAVIAALPGIFTLGLTTFKPDAKSQWWWAKWSKLDELIGALRYDGKSDSDAYKEWNKFIRAHETKYPGWGTPPPGAIA
jgi:hypothetical protein